MFAFLMRNKAKPFLGQGNQSFQSEILRIFYQIFRCRRFHLDIDLSKIVLVHLKPTLGHKIYFTDGIFHNPALVQECHDPHINPLNS